MNDRHLSPLLHADGGESWPDAHALRRLPGSRHGVKKNKWRMSRGKYGKTMIKHRDLNILDGFT